MKSTMAQTYLKTKLCMDMLHTTEVMAIFVIFLPILAKLWLPWQRPLDFAIRNVLFGLIDHENHLLQVITFSLSVVEMYLYALIAIFVPKLVAMVTPLCPLCTGVSQINSSIAQTLSQNQTLHGYVAYN